MITSDIVPVKKVLSIINSCETEEQLEASRRVIDNYVKTISKRGVVNVELVKKRLLQEWRQKRFQLRMMSSFLDQSEREYEVYEAVEKYFKKGRKKVEKIA